MIYWQTIWLIVGLFFSIVSFFPLTNLTHWVFRIFDFIRLQLFILLLTLLLLGIFLNENYSFSVIMTTLFILISLAYHFFTILPFLPKGLKKIKSSKNKIIALSVNVKQENRDYEKLINIVNHIQPDILLTMETDQEWGQGLSQIENYYKHTISVPKDNRYGMYMFTNLDLKDFKVHYLISEEHPSIEALLVDKENNDFIFWGIHPPPPSPTEKPTSKQKDAELIKVAKLALKTEIPVVVSGDFNNVCWSKTSKLFSKISKLKDARVNKGFYSTFPAYFWPFRFPIDLFFHSESITVSKLKVLSSIGSDHLPILSEFHINAFLEPNTQKMNPKLENISNQKIKEGKNAAKNEN